MPAPSTWKASTTVSSPSTWIASTTVPSPSTWKAISTVPPPSLWTQARREASVAGREDQGPEEGEAAAVEKAAGEEPWFQLGSGHATRGASETH